MIYKIKKYSWEILLFIFILKENGKIESQLVCKDNDKS